MNAWPTEDLTRIAATDDLHIAPLRADGTSYGTPTWIGSVVVDGDLYVRAYNGSSSRWYKSAISQGAGRIETAGNTWQVTFEPADRDSDPAVDDACRAKYGSSSYLAHMIADASQAAGVTIHPHDPDIARTGV